MNIYRRTSFFDCLMVEIVCGLSNLCGCTHFRADFRGANPPRIHVRISDKRQRSRGIKVQCLDGKESHASVCSEVILL